MNYIEEYQEVNKVTGEKENFGGKVYIHKNF